MLVRLIHWSSTKPETTRKIKRLEDFLNAHSYYVSTISYTEAPDKAQDAPTIFCFDSQTLGLMRLAEFEASSAKIPIIFERPDFERSDIRIPKSAISLVEESEWERATREIALRLARLRQKSKKRYALWGGGGLGLLGVGAAIGLQLTENEGRHVKDFQVCGTFAVISACLRTHEYERFTQSSFRQLTRFISHYHQDWDITDGDDGRILVRIRTPENNTTLGVEYLLTLHTAGFERASGDRNKEMFCDQVVVIGAITVVEASFTGRDPVSIKSCEGSPYYSRIKGTTQELDSLVRRWMNLSIGERP